MARRKTALDYQADLTDRRFGRLVAMRPERPTMDCHQTWQCKCDCGKEKSVGVRELLRGKTSSCGCLRKQWSMRGDADLTNMRFRMLTVIRPENETGNRFKWWAKCACGNEVLVDRKYLFTGDTKSCGCLRKKPTTRTHGETTTRIYGIWNGIITRCTNKNSLAYESYGGRGIYMCQRWRSSHLNFKADIGDRPTKLHTVDRIDNSNSYTCGKHELCDDCREKNAPANCRWATRKEQAQNTRRNVYYSAFGETLCLAEWSRRYNMQTCTLKARIHRGMTVEDALTVPVRRALTDDEKADIVNRRNSGASVADIVRELGINRSYVYEIIRESSVKWREP